MFMLVTLAFAVMLPASPPLATPEPAPLATSLPRRKADHTWRLQVGGSVALGLGAGLLGVMTLAAVRHTRDLDRLATLKATLLPGQRLSRPAADMAARTADDARLVRAWAIGAGVSAAMSIALATTLFVLARDRRPGPRRLTLAPWWLPSGAGLHVQLRLR